MEGDGMSGTTVQIGDHTVSLSNMDKLLYPDDGISKADVVDYYSAVHEVILPHLADRPLNLRRCPDGIDQSCFFQQHADSHTPDWIATVEVPARGSDSAPVEHLMCQDEASLVYLANLAGLELHRWLSTSVTPAKPNLLVLDIDPPDGVSARELRDAVATVRVAFEAVGLVPFVQTTGGRGFHVVAPLDATEGEEVVRPTARRLADHIARQHPDELTTEQRKAKRGDRIFLDTNRNNYGQTAVAPYSLRARPGAPVATPIDWDELSTVTPDRYHLRNVPRRLAQKADPWRDMERHARSALAVTDRLAARDSD
jgi:bifunctional non-homologous end joining protein LigD